MILTVTLNPAIDKLRILNEFTMHKLHRLEEDEMSLIVPGGKGVNIALNLNLLGNEVVTTGFAGGHAGHWLCDAIRAKGITTSFVFTPGNTRTNTAILDKKNETLTELNDRGHEVSQEDLDFLIGNYTRLLNRVDLVMLAGSLPQGVTPETYRILIDLAREHGIKALIHTSPQNIEGIMGSSPFLINPDMRSNHSLMGKPLDGIDQFQAAGKDLLISNRDTEFILFTHRIENVVAVTRDKSYVLRPKNLKIVNMLGYADAYLAGFIHAYTLGMETVDVLKYASASGLSNVEVLYKEIMDAKKVSENLKRIEVEIIS